MDACIIPTDDTHLSEYVSDHFKYRAWLSGFTGSAGTLVVCHGEAALWTDSRYFLQAGKQLSGSGIQLMKEKTEGCPTIAGWLVAQGCQSVGYDGEVYSAADAEDLRRQLSRHDMTVLPDFQSYGAVWEERPALPEGTIHYYPEEYAGKSLGEKLEEVRALMRQAGTEFLPLGCLDDIAWLMNLRGNDVLFNPVGLSYALIGLEDCRLYLDQAKLSPEASEYLRKNRVGISDYGDFGAGLASLPPDSSVWVDKRRLNDALLRKIPSSCRLVEGILPTTRLKAIKNEVEIEGFRRAVLRDGVAIVRHWRWLEERLNSGIPTDEYEIGEKLAAFRRLDPHCQSESFEPIVGFNANGAIVHYETSAEEHSSVNREGVLLMDHGGQYLEGTTDITRSFSLYENTPEEYKKDYACVLKGHIALSTAVFPEGTRGCQLDALARQYLWKAGYSYAHGTGHGIGHFLNVHEGPQSIRMEENPVRLEPGMVISNEPGLYRTGIWGIRIENMILCERRQDTEFGHFLSFETLTLCPYDLKSINPVYYQPEEIEWINQYHRRVYESLAPLLSEEERIWLAAKTRSIG